MVRSNYKMKKIGQTNQEVMQLISKGNQGQWLHNVTGCLKKLEKNDEWKVYFGVACLSVVLSLLFAIYSAFLHNEPTLQPVDSKSVRHLELTDDRAALQALREIISRRTAAEAIALSESQAASEKQVVIEKPMTAEPVGEWYYDELHKDWRYKK